MVNKENFDKKLEKLKSEALVGIGSFRQVIEATEKAIKNNDLDVLDDVLSSLTHEVGQFIAKTSMLGTLMMMDKLEEDKNE